MLSLATVRGVTAATAMLLIASMLPIALPAQGIAESHLTIALGRAHGIGGDYGARGAYAVGVTFSQAVGTLEDNRWSKRVGVSGGATFGRGRGSCASSEDERCAPRFPLVTLVSPFVGLERAAARGTLGATVGPALFGAGAGGPSARGVGLDARLEGMLDMSEHTGITGALGVLVLPNVGGRTVAVSSLTVGLRLF